MVYMNCGHEKWAAEDGFAPGIAELVRRGAGIIRNGGIVAYPTDTVYGLGADIFNGAAVSRVYSAKSRPPDMPLPVLISDISYINDLTAGRTAEAEKLMEKFWPGALTIIFRRNPSLHSLALAGHDNIGIRLPGHALARHLAMMAGCPITGTSANLHDRPAPRNAVEVASQLGNAVDLIIDGGECPGGKESTIVDATVSPPVIVRQGVIPPEEIRAVIKSGRK